MEQTRGAILAAVRQIGVKNGLQTALNLSADTATTM